jgi:uncharacterized protein YmfQ (DUF2313 family)
MAMTGHDYLLQLQALLPRGLAWAKQQTGTLALLMLAWADEFARVDLRCDQLLNEADPRTTLELLTEWERVAGLPDPCVTIDQSIDQRRAALVSKLTATGGQSRAYFIALAESIGYVGATIDEYAPMTCNDNCDDWLYSEADLFCWQLNLPGSTGGLFVMDCDSDCNSALQSWGDEAIECRVNKFKPAHTNVIFAYI